MPIRTRVTPVTVRGIGEGRHKLSKYIILPIYFRGYNVKDNTLAYASFDRKVTIVDDLKVNILLGIDYLGPEKFDIILSTKSTVIRLYDVRISVGIKRNGRPINVKITAVSYTIIKLRSA